MIAPILAAAGLLLQFTTGDQTDTRESRLVAMALPAADAPTAAVWTGSVLSPLRSEYTFSAQVAGQLTVTVNGKPALTATGDQEQAVTGEPIRLKKGANELRVEYHPPAHADALVRLSWSNRDFPPEPIPPMSLQHDDSAPELIAARQLREGRLLFAERRCAACHNAAGALPAPGHGMPELAQDAPVFAEFGARFNEPWLAHWINNPQSIRPHALMPRLFPGPDDQIDQRAADLAAYLMSLGQRHEAKPDESQAPLGAALFANLGCIACHTPPEFQGDDEHQRTPLNHLRAKWQEPALREYLQDPQKFYRWTRMPNFRLSAEESARLAAFLLSGQQREFAPGPKGDPAKGGQLAVSSGCLNCHAGLPPTSAPQLTEAFSHATKGCLADDATARGHAPDFAFTPDELTALRALAASPHLGFDRDTPGEFLQRQMRVLRCTACHSADGEQSMWSQVEGEMAPLQAGAPLPEGQGLPIAGPTAPLFTWLGEKLRTDWAAQFIAGGISYKPRPWLVARMPGFGVRAQALAEGMAQQHGFPITESGEKPPSPEYAKAGATLIAENGGFNCTTCHGVGTRPPTAVFEAPGINLAYAPERLRKEYFHRWVYFPLRLDPDTKMPRFSDDEGKTPLTDFFEGNAHEQFEAIWQYLRTVPKP